MRLPRLVLAVLPVLALCQGVKTTEGETTLKALISDAQKQIKPAVGESATQCFTDADYANFKMSEKAKVIAQQVSKSARFERGFQAIKGLKVGDRDKAIAELKAIRQKTVAENGGKFGPDSQTEAGAAAQNDIAAEVVKLIESRIKK
jgi:hypothetical protein